MALKALMFLALLVGAIFLANNACATILSMPSNIQFFEATVPVNIKIENPSNIEQALEVDFFAPIQANFQNLPQTIGANETIIVKMNLIPKTELIGSEYESKLAVKIGGELEEKTVRLKFSEKIPIKEEISQESTATNAMAYSFGLVSWNLLMENLSLLDVFLIIVAAVLLIIFISRFVKRIQGGN